jgi:hypothetical protein
MGISKDGKCPNHKVYVSAIEISGSMNGLCLQVGMWWDEIQCSPDHSHAVVRAREEVVHQVRHRTRHAEHPEFTDFMKDWTACLARGISQIWQLILISGLTEKQYK